VLLRYASVNAQPMRMLLYLHQIDPCAEVHTHTERYQCICAMGANEQLMGTPLHALHGDLHAGRRVRIDTRETPGVPGPRVNYTLVGVYVCVCACACVRTCMCVLVCPCVPGMPGPRITYTYCVRACARAHKRVSAGNDGSP
jgi:hypothetical protein